MEENLKHADGVCSKKEIIDMIENLEKDGVIEEFEIMSSVMKQTKGWENPKRIKEIIHARRN